MNKKLNPYNLKRTGMLLMMLLVAAIGHAQSQNDVRKEVRAIYAEAMEKLKLVEDDPIMGVKTTVKTSREVAAVGLCETTTEYFADNAMGVEGQEEALTPYFVRERYVRKQASMRTDYSEYLFHPTTGRLIFYFSKTDDYWAEEAVTVETRYYFTSNGNYSSGSVKLTSVETGQSVPADELQPNEESANEVVSKALRYINTLKMITGEEN